MIPEKCTKEELISFIKAQHYDDKKLELHIKKLRYEKLEAKFDQYLKLSMDVHRRYADILKPYIGKKVSEIPVDIVENANKLLLKFTEYCKQRDRYWEKKLEAEKQWRGE